MNNTWDRFYKDVTKINDTLKTKSLPLFLIDKTENLIWTNYILEMIKLTLKLPYVGKYLE